MRLIIWIVLVAGLQGCAVSESDRFRSQMARDELMEKTALERHLCETELRGAWLCTSPSRRANERYPWLYCSCVDNQHVLD